MSDRIQIARIPSAKSLPYAIVVDGTSWVRVLSLPLAEKLVPVIEESLGNSDAAIRSLLPDVVKASSDPIGAQRQWIADHGGSRAGYIKHYGGDADGASLYDADMARLRLLQDRHDPEDWRKSR